MPVIILSILYLAAKVFWAQDVIVDKSLATRTISGPVQLLLLLIVLLIAFLELDEGLAVLGSFDEVGVVGSYGGVVGSGAVFGDRC